MDCVCDILGVALPSTKARAAVMSTPQPRAESWFSHASAMRFLEYKKDKLDDDTVSTVSTSEQDEFFSCSVVSFAEPLVTQVHERPRTTKEEKRVLYYSEDEYLEFRLEAHSGRRRNRVVKFADEIVSDVHTVPSHEGNKDMFYSEAELQEFLDEFVASLDQSLIY